MAEKEKEERWINTAAFFVFGAVLTGSVVMSATEDILVGTSHPTAALLLATYIPNALCAAILPLFAGWVGHLATRLWISVFSTVGLLLIALPAGPAWKFAGAACIGAAVGISDTLVMAFTARYSDTTVHAYTGGTGLAGILYTVFYTGMTTWLCVSPRAVLLMLLVTPPLALVFYCLMDKRDSQSTVDEAPDQNASEYSELGSDKDDPPTTSTFRERLAALRNIKLLVASLFLGYFSKYLTLQSIVTTLAFPSAPFSPRDHYQYYLTVYLVADFFGCTYGLCFCKCTEKTPVTTRTWVISAFIVVLAVILVLASWFRTLLPNVYVALLIVSLFGFASGVLYCNSYVAVGRGESLLHIEYGRAFLGIAKSAGILAAGLLGLFTEPLLMKHCLQVVGQHEYCLTRFENDWNVSGSCAADIL